MPQSVPGTEEACQPKLTSPYIIRQGGQTFDLDGCSDPTKVTSLSISFANSRRSFPTVSISAATASRNTAASGRDALFNPGG
jgi:hypothetical protein